MIHAPAGTEPLPGAEWLEGARFLDADHPSVRAFAASVTAAVTTPVERAVALFYAVRDRWRYDPFTIRLDAAPYVASNVLGERAAYCIPKAILLAASARAAGIPSGIGLADVENHLSTEKLKARMGGATLFVDHGYAILHLEGRWVKAAPAFNIELCERFHVRPTEFDGRGDALFQEYDTRGHRHMEYVRDHGFWSDLPFERVIADLTRAYPAQLFTAPAGEPFEEGQRL